jgi:hypothetical protein
MEIRYIVRDETTGKIVADFASEQEFPTETISEDHPDLLEFYERLTNGTANIPDVVFANSGPTDLI